MSDDSRANTVSWLKLKYSESEISKTTFTSRDAWMWVSDCFIPLPTCQIIDSGGCFWNGHSRHSSSYQIVLLTKTISSGSHYHMQTAETSGSKTFFLRSIVKEKIHVLEFCFKCSFQSTKTSRLSLVMHLIMNLNFFVTCWHVTGKERNANVNNDNIHGPDSFAQFAADI